ncbi:MAG TPA: FecR family protein [Steroidobacteraceae bacterium]|jgi:ferric-dicitrate binding protein FerR (iron transport regulator)
MKESEELGQNGSDAIGRLIRHAGARQAVPADRFDRARARVAAHWQVVVAEERRLRRSGRTRRVAAAAAVVVAFVAGLLLWQRSSSPALPMATVARAAGQVLVNGEPAAPGDRVATHASIETAADGRLALALDSGHSFRLDHGSRVVVAAADRFEMSRGAVYVDSGPRGAHGPVQVATPYGVVSDIGTQFQLRLSDNALEIGVREGLVQLARRDGSFTVAAGSLRRIGAGGVGSGLPLPASSPWWAWVETVPAEFDIDGATLEQYLGWYARERGLELRWQDAASRENAARVRLSGSIRGLGLEAGLRTVSSIAEFRYALTGSALQVQVQ